MEMTIDDLAELMVKEFARIDRRFDALEERMERIEERMGGLEVRMGALETRMDALEQRMDSLETRMDALETRVAALEELGQDHSGRFISLEDSVAKVQYLVEEADLLSLNKRVYKLEMRST